VVAPTPRETNLAGALIKSEPEITGSLRSSCDEGASHQPAMGVWRREHGEPSEDLAGQTRPPGLTGGAAGGGCEEGEAGALWVGHDGDAAYVLKIGGRQVELGAEFFGFAGYGIAIGNCEVG
jgi:hypothetical protein